MNSFPRLNEVVDKKITVSLDEASKDLIKEIQYKLKLQKLYTYDIDGIVGKLTRKGFAEFKKSVWLAHPDLIGPSVAANLLEVGKHKVSEQVPTDNYNIVDISRTGTQLKLPNGNIVYENEAIIQGIPLTWGEMTKSCTRVPVSNEIVSNIIKTAKLFGEIREAWGSPLGVTSGYRPPAINKAVGGTSQSKHILGLAIDYYPIGGNVYKLYDIVLGVMKARGRGGLGRGMKKGFIHSDVERDSLVIFNY